MASGNAKNDAKGKVYTVTGTATNYVNLIAGFVSYAHRYFYAVDHNIDISYDNNDVVITVRIKNVADKIPRFD